MKRRHGYIATLILGLAANPATSAHAEFNKIASLMASDAVRTAQWQAWIDGELTAADSWTNVQHDDITWVGGWPHDHIDPITGRFRPWTPLTPRPAESLNDGKVAAGWIAITREYNLRQILKAARLAGWADKPALKVWARSELSLYADIYSQQSARGLREKSVLFTESLQEAVVLPSLLEAIRLLTPGAKSEELAKWRDFLIAPMVENLMRSQHEVSNKSVWRTVGIALAGQQYANMEWKNFTTQGQWSFASQLAQGLTEDGYWFELSTQYHEYVLQALFEYLSGLRDLNALDQADKTALAGARSMFRALFNVRFRNGEGPLMNDGSPGRKVPTDTTMGWAWRALPADAEATTWKAISPNWELLLARPPTGTKVDWRPRDPNWQGVEMIDGLKTVQLSQGPWRAVMRAGQRAKYHAHQDALSIELMFGEEWVFRNPGTQSYGSPIHQNYFKKAIAHSSPLLGGNGAVNLFRDARIELISPQQVTAIATEFGKGVNVSRTLEAVDGVWRDTINFSGANAERGTSAVFHTPCRVTFPDRSTFPSSESNSTEEANQILSPYAPARRTVPFDKQLTLRLNCGAQVLSVSIITQGVSRLILGSSPGGPGGMAERSFIWLKLPDSTRPSIQMEIKAEHV